MKKLISIIAIFLFYGAYSQDNPATFENGIRIYQPEEKSANQDSLRIPIIDKDGVVKSFIYKDSISGGSVSGDYIPLSGTEENKPVTGFIELEPMDSYDYENILDRYTFKRDVNFDAGGDLYTGSSKIYISPLLSGNIIEFGVSNETDTTTLNSQILNSMEGIMLGQQVEGGPFSESSLTTLSISATNGATLITENGPFKAKNDSDIVTKGFADEAYKTSISDYQPNREYTLGELVSFQGNIYRNNLQYNYDPPTPNCTDSNLAYYDKYAYFSIAPSDKFTDFSNLTYMWGIKNWGTAYDYSYTSNQDELPLGLMEHINSFSWDDTIYFLSWNSDGLVDLFEIELRYIKERTELTFQELIIESRWIGYVVSTSFPFDSCEEIMETYSSDSIIFASDSYGTYTLLGCPVNSLGACSWTPLVTGGLQGDRMNNVTDGFGFHLSNEYGEVNTTFQNGFYSETTSGDYTGVVNITPMDSYSELYGPGEVKSYSISSTEINLYSEHTIDGTESLMFSKHGILFEDEESESWSIKPQLDAITWIPLKSQKVQLPITGDDGTEDPKTLLVSVNGVEADENGNVEIEAGGTTPTLSEVLAEGNIADRDIKSVGVRGEITLSSNSGSLRIDQSNVDGHEIQNSLGLTNSPALTYNNFTLGETSQINYDTYNYQWILHNSGISDFKGLVGSSYFGANYDDNTYVQKKYVDDAIDAIPTPSLTLEQARQNGNTVTGTIKSSAAKTLENATDANSYLALGNVVSTLESDFLFLGAQDDTDRARITIAKDDGITVSDNGLGIGLVGDREFSKGGNRTAYAQIGDVEDAINDLVIPAQVNLTGGTNVTITGTYPNLTINSSGGGGSLTLEQARQNGNVLEGGVNFIADSALGFIQENSDGSVGVWEFDHGSTTISGYDENNSWGIGISKESAIINSTDSNFQGIIGNQEFDKQGDRKAFAQIADVEDASDLLVSKEGISLVEDDFTLQSDFGKLGFNQYGGGVSITNTTETAVTTLNSLSGGTIKPLVYQDSDDIIFQIGTHSIGSIYPTQGGIWSIIKNTTDSGASLLQLPVTGLSQRYIPVSINGQFADSNGNISLSVPESEFTTEKFTYSSSTEFTLTNTPKAVVAVYVNRTPIFEIDEEFEVTGSVVDIAGFDLQSGDIIRVTYKY